MFRYLLLRGLGRCHTNMVSTQKPNRTRYLIAVSAWNFSHYWHFIALNVFGGFFFSPLKQGWGTACLHMFPVGFFYKIAEWGGWSGFVLLNGKIFVIFSFGKCIAPLINTCNVSCILLYSGACLNFVFFLTKYLFFLEKFSKIRISFLLSWDDMQYCLSGTVRWVGGKKKS